MDQPAQNMAPTVPTDTEGPPQSDIPKDLASPVTSNPSLEDDDLVQDQDAASRLKAFTTEMRDQDDLERQIAEQAEEVLTAQNDELDFRRIEKMEAAKAKANAELARIAQRMAGRASVDARATAAHRGKELQEEIKCLDEDISEIEERIKARKTTGNSEKQAGDVGPSRQANESRHEYLVRTGKITPFSKGGKSLTRETADLQEALAYIEDQSGDDGESNSGSEADSPKEQMSHQHLRRPGFEADVDEPDVDSPRSIKRRKLSTMPATGDEDADFEPEPEPENSKADMDDFVVEDDEIESDDSDMATTIPAKKNSRNKVTNVSDSMEDLQDVDDGNESLYQARLKSWVQRRSHARQQAKLRAAAEETESMTDEAQLSFDREDEKEEWELPHPTIASTKLNDELEVPGDIYPSLFDYQKTGVKWLSELYTEQTGGIVGDEMGLGKTIQVISFLASLHHSGRLDKPVIVVAPATVMKQWVNEFHRWWPPLRVSILHTSGSGMMNLQAEEDEEEWLNQSSRSNGKASKAFKQASVIANRVERKGHVLVTTYAGLQSYSELLIPIAWGHAILDEGHKIRNPNAGVTIHCKELRTINRIILSGTPIQNNLTELWSLFDFISPMRLGTLVDFRNQFEIPIKQGGYASASALQIRTATKCAETLKDAISKYLLQRYKIDVAADLPKKVEQVLFCKLTRYQRRAYERFLESPETSSILNGKRHVLYGVDILRKICNHPDLVDREILLKRRRENNYDYGTSSKSGKMQVVQALLETWKDGGHKTLLFCQTRIMLDILETFITKLPGVKARRMDGTTPIEKRQTLIDEFNNSEDIHVFLLTTKVGGLGINLTGADRVLIFDPDWNPSTDIQARERAWRLGQKKQVTIYRLMTAGTIEEKIYHRQVFKQLLTNKVMKDPTQRQSFEMQNLHDLFTLGKEGNATTETGKLFDGTERTFDSDSLQHSNGIESSRAQQSVSATAADRGNGTINGVASIEDFRNDDDKETSSNGDNNTTSASGNSEDRIMDALFARSGVQSALEHDQIIHGKRVIAPDHRIIEKEAKRVAAEAASALKSAAKAAQSVPIGTPTWTGEFGSAGRPALVSRGGRSGGGGGVGAPSSTSILAGLQDRRGGGGAGGMPSSTSILAGLQDRRGGGGGGQQQQGRAAGSESVAVPRGKDFVKLIREYLLAHDGVVVSQMLVNHFNHIIKTDQQQVEFTTSLKQIATLDKSQSLRGRWTLKDEYR